MGKVSGFPGKGYPGKEIICGRDCKRLGREEDSEHSMDERAAPGWSEDRTSGGVVAGRCRRLGKEVEQGSVRRGTPRQ